MTNFEIVPLQNVGPVSLGMSRQQVREAVKVPVVSFDKSAGAGSPTDAFFENAFQVFYDTEDRAEFIELSRGGPFVALYKGVSIFETKADDLIALVSQTAPFDPNGREPGYTFVFPELEVSLWRQSLPETGDLDEDEEYEAYAEDEEPGAYFDTIGIGQRGYYNGTAV